MKTRQLLVIRIAIALSLVWQVWHVNVNVTHASVASPALPSTSHNQVTQSPAPLITPALASRPQPSMSESPIVAPTIAPAQAVGPNDMGDLVAPTLPLADVVLVLPAGGQPVSQALPRLQPQTQSGQAPWLSTSQVTFYPSAATTDGAGGDRSPLYSTLSPLNVAFKINFDPRTQQSLAPSTQPAQGFTLGVDYSSITIPYGGDFIERMALYEGFGCTFDAAGHLADCAMLVPLHGYHDYARRQLVATIDVATLDRWASGSSSPRRTVGASAEAVFAHNAYMPAVSNNSSAGDAEVPPDPGDTGGGIVILSAGTDSPTGDYGATPVGDVLDYQIGLFSGSAQTRYPIPVPPAAADPAPEVSLNYDSASVDGTSISRSPAQWAWAGPRSRAPSCGSCAPRLAGPATCAGRRRARTSSFP